MDFNKDTVGNSGNESFLDFRRIAHERKVRKIDGMQTK
jgi:hypothetical protein